MRLCLLILLLSFNSVAWSEDLALKTLLQMQQITTLTDIGSIKVPALGGVSFTAQREGKQVLIYATGPDGAMLGRAEATIGLSSTPIHIKTPDGLKKIEIIWASSPGD